MRFLIENQKSLKEFGDIFKESFKKNEKEKNIENNEKEENIEKNKIDSKKVDSSFSKDHKIIISCEEENSFLKLLSLMENFPDKIVNIKKHPILVNFSKEWIYGFLGKTFRKINKINKQSSKHQKQVIDPKDKTHNIYESILNLVKQRDRNKLFSKLKDISLDYLKKEEKNILINISINIYNDLTDAQKEKIKNKYSNK